MPLSKEMQEAIRLAVKAELASVAIKPNLARFKFPPRGLTTEEGACIKDAICALLHSTAVSVERRADGLWISLSQEQLTDLKEHARNECLKKHSGPIDPLFGFTLLP